MKLKSIVFMILFCFVLPMRLKAFVELEAVLKSFDIGSDTAVNRFSAYQKLGNGTRVAGFASLEGGFGISGSSATAVFDSFFQVSGTIDFNGGTLYLNRDLIFRDDSTINSLGNITGNNHDIVLSSAMSIIPETPGVGDVEFSDVHLFLNGNISINSTMITCKGNSTIHGQGNCLSLSQTSTIVVDSNASLLIKDITIEGIIGSNIYCVDNTSTLSVDNVTWILEDDYTFGAGVLDILNDFHIIGENCGFNYQTDQESIIRAQSRFIFDHNVAFDYAPPIALGDLLGFVDDTSQLVLSGATLCSTSTGLQLKKGTLVVDRKSYISSDASVEGEAISFGDGQNASNNFYIELLPAANVDIISGYVVYNNV